jgi:hypothetical protein
MYGSKFLANLESKSKQILHMEEKIEDMFFFMEDAFFVLYNDSGFASTTGQDFGT